MFQIKNNIVYLTRGEDAVYTRSIRRADKYYSPYVIAKGLKNPKIRMTIKANKNDKEPLLNYEGFIGSEIPTFDSQVSLNIEPPLPTQDIKNQVYRITLRNEVTDKPEYTYHYYDGKEWQNYELIIRIPINSEDTINLTPGTYYYDIALITRDENGEINYSNTWLTPTEFIIGGSYGY